MELSCLPPYTVCMYRHCISGRMLYSQLCKHCPHKSPQPTQPLWLNTPTVRMNWMSPPFLTGVFSQVPEIRHLSYSSFPLLPETHHSAQGCLHLLFPESGEGRGQSIIWEKTWVFPKAEYCGNLVSSSSQAEASKLQSPDVCHLDRACKKQCGLPCCSSCLFSPQFPFFGSSCKCLSCSWAGQ